MYKAQTKQYYVKKYKAGPHLKPHYCRYVIIILVFIKPKCL